MTARHLARLTAWTMAGAITSVATVAAHGGMPLPVVSRRAAGPYIVSLWADPDVSDHGMAMGRFWVMLEPVARGTALPADTRVRVSIRPLDGQGRETVGNAAPVEGAVSRQFVALLIDHESAYGVRVSTDGPLGHADVDATVDAAYDMRPQPVMVLLYVVPFLAAGWLWLKLFLRRRQAHAYKL